MSERAKRIAEIREKIPYWKRAKRATVDIEWALDEIEKLDLALDDCGETVLALFAGR